MIIVYVIVITFIFSILLFIFMKKLVDLGCNPFLCLFAGLIYLPYWWEGIPKTLMEGFVTIGLIVAMINYLEKNKLAFLFIFALLSLLRSEFFIVIIVLLIYYYFKNYISKLTLSIFVFFLILLGGWNIYWSSICGDTSGIWSWGHRYMLRIKYNLIGKEANKMTSQFEASIIENYVNRKVDINSYEFFVLLNSKPFNKIVNEEEKKWVITNVNSKIFKTVIYRVFIRNPYLFIFSQPLGNFLKEANFNIFLKYIKIFYYLWGFLIIIAIIKLLINKQLIEIILIYLIILIVNDFYYFAGGVQYWRFKTFYSILEIFLVCMSFRNFSIGFMPGNLKNLFITIFKFK